jgi:hypothetical protein
MVNAALHCDFCNAGPWLRLEQFVTESFEEQSAPDFAWRAPDEATEMLLQRPACYAARRSQLVNAALSVSLEQSQGFFHVARKHRQSSLHPAAKLSQNLVHALGNSDAGRITGAQNGW